jgi:hypothetical protein
MKLTDDRIDEIINQCCDRYGELICGLTGFARAIEAACKPKWLPMESAPREQDHQILMLTHWGEIKVGEFGWFNAGKEIWETDSGDGHHQTKSFVGWMPLLEVSE